MLFQQKKRLNARFSIRALATDDVRRKALIGSYSPAPDDNEPEPPKEPPPPSPPDDDRISLSPLSSGDEKIEKG
ncbi:uncharacterized protein LOC143897684 [Temnothorax americanus]|uniref:uncharacterized protein LOC143897684 n=1 Tax=Temnothorax americanus TaxID=1964332 RepID=UPI004067DEDD